MPVLDGRGSPPRAAHLKGALEGGKARRGAVHIDDVHLEWQRHARVRKVPGGGGWVGGCEVAMGVGRQWCMWCVRDGVESLSGRTAGEAQQLQHSAWFLRLQHTALGACAPAGRHLCPLQVRAPAGGPGAPPQPASPGQKLLLRCRRALRQRVPQRQDRRSALASAAPRRRRCSLCPPLPSQDV